MQSKSTNPLRSDHCVPSAIASINPQAAVICTGTCKDGFEAEAEGFGVTFAQAQTNANNLLDVVCSVHEGIDSYDTCTPS